jgi:hypothetical protein
MLSWAFTQIKSRHLMGAVDKKYLYTHVTLTNLQDSVTKVNAEEVKGKNFF